MLNKNTTLTTFFASILLIGGALALRAGASSARPPAQPTAIAVVDIVDVIAGLDEPAVLEEQLNSRRELRQRQLDEIVEELKILEADLQMLTRGTDEHREKLREYLEKQAVAKARREVLSQIVSIDLGSVRAGMYMKVEQAIADIANRDGYDIVLMDDSQFPLPENAPDADVYRAIITKSVVYRHESIDITQQVITLMNNEFNSP
ncbi:MAG: OmpH family outer membrane protein [Phycisphaerales bacterium]